MNAWISDNLRNKQMLKTDKNVDWALFLDKSVFFNFFIRHNCLNWLRHSEYFMCSTYIRAQNVINHVVMVLSDTILSAGYNVLKYFRSFFIQMSFVIRVVLNWLTWADQFSDINASCKGFFSQKVC